MSDLQTAEAVAAPNHGWRVTFAALGINLALGILYTWSIISGGIKGTDWGASWTQADRSLPYSVACLVFCLIMVPAGRMQDRLSPRLVASIGGILVGAGMIVTSFMTTPMGYVLGFGVLAGAGIGFGYASATPPAVKWFPPAKTGMIAGIVVSGFGLASVYAAPLARWLMDTFSLPTMMMSFGIGFTVVVVGLAQLLKPPHKARQFIRGFGKIGTLKAEAEHGAVRKVRKENFTTGEMLKTWQFYMLWFMYACGAGAGLMIISVAKNLGKELEVGTALVVGLSIGNGGGRILAGWLFDKIGRKTTMCFFFVLQAVLVLLLSLATDGGGPLNTVPAMIAIIALVGACYGSNLALFPSITKGYYGLDHFGMNYGVVFTAWGIGGFLLAQFAAKVRDATDSFQFAFYTSAALLIVAAVMTFVVRTPHHMEHPVRSDSDA